MNATQTPAALTPVQIHADHDSSRQLGSWTTARAFLVRARRSQVVIDLRSAQIPDGDIELDLNLDHATITLLVAEETVIDQWDLAWTGRGKVKQTFHHNPAGTGRRIRLTGQARQAQVRVRSGGIAQLSAMGSREYRAEARRAHARAAELRPTPGRIR